MFITTGFLATDVKKPNSTLGAYLRATFPNLKPLQAQYKQDAEPLRVEGSRATAAIIGTAMDLIVRLMLSPDETPESATMMYPFNTGFREVVDELAHLVARSSDEQTQARAVFAIAECVAAFRAGRAYAPVMYERVQHGLFQVGDALSDASAESIDELVQLRRIAQERLLPHLEAPFSLGPTFDLTQLGPSQRLAGEADLISNGLLIDVKATMGQMNSRGERPDALLPEHIYQLLGYALLDHSDRYKIDRIAIYSARYGQLHAWPLSEVVEITTGGVVDFDDARNVAWAFMQEEPQRL